MSASTAVDDVVVLPIRANDGLVRAIGNCLADSIDNPDLRALNRLIFHKNFQQGRGEYISKLLQRGHLEGKRVILVDTMTSGTNTNERAWTRVALMTRMAKMYGATEVNLAQFPLWGARQDEDPRIADELGDTPLDDPDEEKHRIKIHNMFGEPASLDAYIDFIHHLGIKRVITKETHNPEGTRELFAAKYGTADGHFFDLDPFILFAHYLKTYPLRGEDGTLLQLGKRGENVVLIGFDKGSWPRVDRFRHYLGFDKAGAIKNRKVRERRGREPEELNTSHAVFENYTPQRGELEGKIAIAPEDLYDSGNTHETAVNSINYTQEGIPQHFLLFVPYPYASGNGFEILQRTRTNMVTDTSRPNIAEHEEYGTESINVLYSARWIAEEFKSILGGQGALLTPKNFPNLDQRFLKDLYEVRTASDLILFGNL